ncbi:MAG TPA: hypothetical protein VGS58_22095, partial [Candidatus Sulfopaludibacter sp.]|nr:hypothetical protein [Candidatus Sulfopaludibacter sp.]
KGFTTREIQDLEVSVGRTLDLIIPMQSDRVEEKMADFHPQPVDDTKNVVSLNVTPEQLDSLPSPNRVLSPFVLLSPAATADRSSGDVAFRGEAMTNSILTDGADTTTTYHLRQPAAAPQIAPQVSEDAVGELQVIAAGWPAEFGRSLGGVVNGVTRSGTNALHGDGYEYYGSRNWAAADRHAAGFYPGGKAQQAGGSLGGPILPGKVFGFVNFEALDNNSQSLSRITNPLIGSPYGILVSSNCKATAAQCAAAFNFLNAQNNLVVQRSQNWRTGLAKIDYRPNQANSITVEGDAMHRSAPDGIVNQAVNPNGGLSSNGSYYEDTGFAKAGYTRTITAGSLNEARAAWYRDSFSEYGDSKYQPSTGPVGITIAGTSVGGASAYPSSLDEKRLQLVDNFTLTSASSTLKLGVDYERTEDRMYNPANAYGTYDYASLTAFAEDFTGNTKILKNYTDFTQSLGKYLTDLQPRMFSIYAQDIWKVSLHFTVTAGVRFEKTEIPQPTTANSSYYQTGTIGSPNTDFSPRLGLAYRFDDKTVFRAGLGTYYQPFPGELMRLLYSWNGVYQKNVTVTPLQSGSPVFPSIYTPGATLPSGTQDLAFVASKFRNPYTADASAEFEREIGKGATVTLGYVYSRGLKLWTLQDQNLYGTTTTTGKIYTIDGANGNQVSTYSPGLYTNRSTYAHIWEIQNGGSAYYYAVFAQFQKQLWHGLTVHGAYTWSHATDDVSGPPVMAFVPASTTPGDFRGDEGPSSLDQRQRAVVNFTWQPKVGSDLPAAARYLVNGWQISSIATLAAGLPATPLVVVNGQQFSGVTMAYTSTLNGTDGWQRVPFEGVNSLRMGPQHTLDARVSRTIQFTERVKGVLMFEAFNALNSQFDTSVNTIAYAATLGVLKPVAGLGAGTASWGPVNGTNARQAQVAFRVVF